VDGWCLAALANAVGTLPKEFPGAPQIMPSKNEIIERIRQINRSADQDWLARFDDQKLHDYLEHLQLLMEPRGRKSVWRRRGDSPAVAVSVE